MILPDVNLLLYSVNTDSLDHVESFKWWRDLLQSGQPVGIYSGVAFAFVRLSTNRRVFPNPFTVSEAFAYLNNWLSFPSVQLLEAEAEDLAVAEKLLLATGTGSNLVSDAQIAAAALRLKGTVHSADADFRRFPDLQWCNPLDG